MEYFTDQIGEWVAVLNAIRDRDPHPYRSRKLGEIIEFLREQRETNEVKQ